jgi:hypothetical protein
MNNDKRKTRRRSLRRPAWLALGKLHDCKLSDISDGGARIDLEDNAPIPDHFMLLLSNNGAARRACRVVWRSPQQLGVKFETHWAGAAQAAKAAREPKPDTDPAPTESEPADGA